MGRPGTKARPRSDTAPAQAVHDIVRALPPDAWIRHRVTEGEKGPREYEFARLRVVEKVHRAPGSEGWLLARRPVGSDQGAQIKCYLDWRDRESVRAKMRLIVKTTLRNHRYPPDKQEAATELVLEQAQLFSESYLAEL